MTGSTRRTRAPLVLAVVYAILAAGAWVQVLINLFSRGEPAAIAAFHVLIAISGTAVAIGSWRMASWAWITAVAYGAATVGLLLSLTPLLKLDPSATSGIRSGAAIVALFTVLVAWYLRRSFAPRPATEPPTA